jgi:hypothetical protein
MSDMGPSIQRQVIPGEVDHLADPHPGLGHQQIGGLAGPRGGVHDRVKDSPVNGTTATVFRLMNDC